MGAAAATFAALDGLARALLRELQASGGQYGVLGTAALGARVQGDAGAGAGAGAGGRRGGVAPAAQRARVLLDLVFWVERSVVEAQR